MTSEKVSFINMRDMQKNLFRRRVWLIALALLVFFAYFVGFRTFNILSYSGYADAGEVASRITDTAQLVNKFLIPLISGVGAVLLGIQGFLWIDNKKQLDFYESLPVSRSGRFWNIVLNSYVIYAGAYLAAMLIGMLVVFVLGGGSSELMTMDIRYFVKGLCFFTAVFGAVILAMMLTGNGVIAVLMTIVLLTYEMVLNITLSSYCSSMLPTYADSGIVTSLFSPIRLAISSGAGMLGMIWNLCSGVILLLLAFIVYYHRKNEDAGKPVLHAPVRAGFKLAVAIEAGLLIGIIFYSVGGDIPCVAFGIIAAVVMGGIMEVVYGMDIRCMVRKMYTTLLAAACVVLIFCVFRFDLVGYNSWVPDANQVESAYITMFSGLQADYVGEEGEYLTQEEYAAENMKLTDISTMNTLLKTGEENMVRLFEDDATNEKQYGSSMLLYYRMKDGSTKGRRIYVSSADAALMDRIVGSQEFREGYLQVWNDSFMEAHAGSVQITYSNGNYYGEEETIVTGSDAYAKFKAAYRKDLEKFNFSFASTTSPIGMVNIFCETRNSQDELSYSSIEFPVYETFTNTIAFLKDAGLYLEPDTDLELSGPFKY